ncbi:TorD/DmsD family molecular chaperone [Ferrimonas pelagia]|uniref:Tat proofreading chaperone DmsD n=1 Tax=Ferrimonas pelagia TaxID=1177826 RepID=A0ABP9F2D4_9GAMM
MLSTEQRQETLAALDVLATLFYRPLEASTVEALDKEAVFEHWPQWLAQKPLTEQLQRGVTYVPFEQLKQDHYDLLLAPKGRKAYPWGSVYTSRENRLFAESSVAYQAFCKQHQIQFELSEAQPLDHFGLMLGATAHLLLQQQDEAVSELLGVHLLPWSGRFLQCMNDSAQTELYQQLALLAESTLDGLSQALSVTVVPVPLYK